MGDTPGHSRNVADPVSDVLTCYYPILVGQSYA